MRLFSAMTLEVQPLYLGGIEMSGGGGVGESRRRERAGAAPPHSSGPTCRADAVLWKAGR